MEIASRTPEGLPNRCPVCGNDVKIEPSTPGGDAPCPHCGTLLWFVSTDDGSLMFSALALRFRPSASSTGEARPDRAERAPVRWQGQIETGDRVRITEGTFENFEGQVDNIDPTGRRVTVLITIFGRVTPVELELSQIERLSD
jgi:hypothetical protein